MSKVQGKIQRINGKTMKITKTRGNPDDLDWAGYSRRFKMSDFDFKTMEFTRTQVGNALITDEVPIASIIIEDFGDSATIHFGNLCHIHLDHEEFRKFKEGVDYIWEEIKVWDNAIEIKMTKKEKKIWEDINKQQEELQKKQKEWYERNKK